MSLQFFLKPLALTALLCAVAPVAQARTLPVALTCPLIILCPDTGACRDWDQTITITEEPSGWQVTWNTDLPSDYELVADLAPPDGAADPLCVRSLLFRNAATRATQMVTFDSAGNAVVTGHQPLAGIRMVSGIGTCVARQ